MPPLPYTAILIIMRPSACAAPRPTATVADFLHLRAKLRGLLSPLSSVPASIVKKVLFRTAIGDRFSITTLHLERTPSRRPLPSSVPKRCRRWKERVEHQPHKAQKIEASARFRWNSRNGVSRCGRNGPMPTICGRSFAKTQSRLPAYPPSDRALRSSCPRRSVADFLQVKKTSHPVLERLRRRMEFSIMRAGPPSRGESRWRSAPASKNA